MRIIYWAVHFDVSPKIVNSAERAKIYSFAELCSGQRTVIIRSKCNNLFVPEKRENIK